MQTPLIVANCNITQDNEGRYCLNELHRAAGGEQKHKPANFMRLDSTKALVAEIKQGSEVSNAFVVLHGGKFPGTYVCREITMKTYICLYYLELALRHKVAVLASPSRITGGWLVKKPAAQH